MSSDTPGAGDNTEAFAESIAAFEIDRLQRRYGDIVTRRAWDELHTVFEDDATISIDRRDQPAIEVIGPTGIGEFIERAVDRFSFFEFAVLNFVTTHIDLHAPGGPVGSGRLWIMEVRCDAETGVWSHAYGLYNDEYRHAGGTWRYSKRRYGSLARRGDDGTSEVFGFTTR